MNAGNKNTHEALTNSIGSEIQICCQKIIAHRRTDLGETSDDLALDGQHLVDIHGDACNSNYSLNETDKKQV